MRVPVLGGNILYYGDSDIQSARITWVNSDNSVSLVAFPASGAGINFQSRENVPYAPFQPGGWGWNEELERDRYPAAESLSGHRVVTLNEELELIYADCTIATHAHKVFGLITDAGAQGDRLSVYSGEVVTEPSWSWEPGRSLFLYVDGTMTQNYRAVRDAGGFTLIVAEAIAPSSIFFAPKMPTMRI